MKVESFFINEGYSDVDKAIAVGVADVVGFVSTESIWGGLTFSAVTAVVAWWDDIIDALGSFWDWLF